MAICYSVLLLRIYIGRRLSTYSTYWSWCCIMTPLTHTAGMPSNGGNFRIQGEVVDVAFSIFIWLPLIFWMLWLLLSPRNALNQELLCAALFLAVFRILFYIDGCQSAFMFISFSFACRVCGLPDCYAQGNDSCEWILIVKYFLH